MSLLRRRMMMASSVKEPDVPDTPTEELDYLTIIPLHEEEVWYYIYPYGGSNDLNMWSPVYTQAIPFHYRINRGEWVEVNLPESDSLAWPVKLNKDTELQLKCMGSNFSEVYATDTQYFKISSGGYHSISGTPMSLLYGDGFKEYNYTGDNKIFGLFSGNDGLTKILNPKTFLPYIELGNFCYESMFMGCVNLTNAPELPAEILVSGCYCNMFVGCRKINYIKMLATDISASACLSNWVKDVSPTGTFVKHPDMTSLPTGVNGIPEGWAVVNDGEESGGGNDFGIEFPLYLEFDYCEENFLGVRTCERAADELGVKLYNCVKSIIDEYGEDVGLDIILVSEQILDMLGIEIYIQNIKVVSVHLQYSEYSLILEDDYYPYSKIYFDGRLFMEV